MDQLRAAAAAAVVAAGDVCTAAPCPHAVAITQPKAVVHAPCEARSAGDCDVSNQAFSCWWFSRINIVSTRASGTARSKARGTAKATSRIVNRNGCICLKTLVQVFEAEAET
jgi:hypothetical protein